MAMKKKSRIKAKAKPKPKTPAKSRPKARPKKAVKAKAKARVAAPRAIARPARAVRALPDVQVATTGGQTLRLAALKGRPVVIYFYPKDDTPGCTTEGCDIRDNWSAFRGLGAVVLGVSRDSVASHERFKAKFKFPFELVSDGDERLCKLFDVIKEKSLYGKKYIGVDRSTFVFDRSGALRKAWRGVKVPGHVQEVLAEVQKL
jgi:peroxiredoxin Q/BCP